MQGSCSACASARAVDTPMRIPVKEPGPTETAICVSCDFSTPHVVSSFWISGIRFLRWFFASYEVCCPKRTARSMISGSGAPPGSAARSSAAEAFGPVVSIAKMYIDISSPPDSLRIADRCISCFPARALRSDLPIPPRRLPHRKSIPPRRC